MAGKGVNKKNSLTCACFGTQDCDVYLLDDVLAAVDPPVAAALWARAICGPLLAAKTRLVVTHSRRFAGATQLLLRLDGGRLAYFGAPEADPFGLWAPGLQQPDTPQQVA
jgi:ABC-type transport system involved in cytochrome bd biosynthesis fused ATPase/permease subunit